MYACPRACAYAKKWWNDFRSVFGVVSINVAERLQHPGILQACKCKVTNYYLQADGFEDGLPRLSLRFPEFPAISLNQLLFEQKKASELGAF